MFWLIFQWVIGLNWQWGYVKLTRKEITSYVISRELNEIENKQRHQRNPLIETFAMSPNMTIFRPFWKFDLLTFDPWPWHDGTRFRKGNIHHNLSKWITYQKIKVKNPPLRGGGGSMVGPRSTSKDTIEEIKQIIPRTLTNKTLIVNEDKDKRIQYL